MQFIMKFISQYIKKKKHAYAMLGTHSLLFNSHTLFGFFFFFVSFCRVGGVSEEVPSLLVQVCQYLPYLGVLSILAEDQAHSLLDCHGSICWPGHHYLHCPQYPLHGHGALSNDTPVWECPGDRQFGKKLQFSCVFPFLVFFLFCHLSLLVVIPAWSSLSLWGIMKAIQVQLAPPT